MQKKCFEFEDYKEFLKTWVRSQPHGGRGIYRKIAEHLRIHSTLLSHILRGKQNFTEDQALALSEYLGLSEVETDYFIELVRMSRASTQNLRDRIETRLNSFRAQSREIQHRISAHHELTLEDSAHFYSSWHYSALRLLADIPGFQNREGLIGALDIPREVAQEAIGFLLDRGLIREEKGRLTIGPSRTHLSSQSRYVWILHKNWRLKAIECHNQVRKEELFYTAPMSISMSAARKIRELLVQTISEATKFASEGRPQKLVGLNIDWFEVK